jgi:hypothetical protein
MTEIIEGLVIAYKGKLYNLPKKLDSLETNPNFEFDLEKLILESMVLVE